MLSSTSVTAWVLAWTSLCKQKCETLAQLLLLYFFMVLCAESYWRRTWARLKPSRWNARTNSSVSVCSTTLQAPVYAYTAHQATVATLIHKKSMQACLSNVAWLLYKALVVRSPRWKCSSTAPKNQWKDFNQAVVHLGTLQPCRCSCTKSATVLLPGQRSVWNGTRSNKLKENWGNPGP